MRYPLHSPDEPGNPGGGDVPGSQSNEMRLLADYLLADNPVHVVTIGKLRPDILWSEEKTFSVPGNHVQSLSAYTQPALENADEGVAENQVALLALDDESEAVEHSLGKAVRLFPHRLVVYTGNEELDDTVFYAFGFRRLSVVSNPAADPVRWFEYCLRDYKQSPDWLNARFWANPERFELDNESDIYCDDEEE